MTNFPSPEQPSPLHDLDAGYSAAPRRRRRAIHMTVRDLRVLELLVARRVESLDALHRVAFPTVSRKRALNRLGELVAAGYLDRRSVELPGSDRPQSVYFLTARGRTALQIRSEEASGWFATRQWRLDLSEPSIPHQIVTNRVCDWLGAKVVPEHLLPPVPGDGRSSSKRRVRPDAVYEARGNYEGRTRVWVEVDLGHYNRSRIIEKVVAAGEDSSVFLLIACPTPAREQWLERVVVGRFGREIWQRIDVKTFAALRRGLAPSLEEALRPSEEPPGIPTQL